MSSINKGDMNHFLCIFNRLTMTRFYRLSRGGSLKKQDKKASNQGKEADDSNDEDHQADESPDSGYDDEDTSWHFARPLLHCIRAANVTPSIAGAL